MSVEQAWNDVTNVSPGLVTFRSTCVFESDGAVLTSDSTLRFRTRAEVTDSLSAAGFTVAEVRDAPDRPGREFVFIAIPGSEPGDPGCTTDTALAGASRGSVAQNQAATIRSTIIATMAHSSTRRAVRRPLRHWRQRWRGRGWRAERLRYPRPRHSGCQGMGTGVSAGLAFWASASACWENHAPAAGSVKTESVCRLHSGSNVW